MERLCKLCGDSFEVQEYERLTPLSVSSESLRSSVSNVRPGDCVVAFSRKYIHMMKKEIEMKSAHQCCVVYGSLPPSTRKEQARRFNNRASPDAQDDPRKRYDILVASDAVGMGLNLEIKRIVFSQIEKFDGISMRPLNTSEVLQIAGRAGRFGTANPEGEVRMACHFICCGLCLRHMTSIRERTHRCAKSRSYAQQVTCLHEEDMPELHSAFHAQPEPLTKAVLRPELLMIEDFWRFSNALAAGVLHVAL